MKKFEIRPGEFVEVSAAAMERARAALERTNKLLKVFEDMPDPKCNVCGRVIYCGVNHLCDREPCGLKR